jgi:protein gp37
MGVTKIQWTSSIDANGERVPGYSFNPWIGCLKVSAGCANCYAMVQDNRFSGNHWGANAQRRVTSDQYWKKPYQWNRKAEKLGVRHKVFCASMSDVFEDLHATHPDRDTINTAREKLFQMIEATPYLDWLLLTELRPPQASPL